MQLDGFPGDIIILNSEFRHNFFEYESCGPLGQALNLRQDQIPASTVGLTDEPSRIHRSEDSSFDKVQLKSLIAVTGHE